MDIPFTSSDIWLLLSVAMAEDQPDRSAVRLKDVLFAGDAINHAVFTGSELRRGFAKLTQAGYVVDSDGAYSLTSAGRDVVNRAHRKSAYWLDQWHYLEGEFHASRGPEDSPTFENLRFPYPQITDDVVQKAFEEYRAEFEEILKRLEAEEKS